MARRFNHFHMLFLIIILSNLSPGFVSTVDAADLHVAPTGATFTSIQAAVDAAAPGDTVMIAAGTYSDMHTRTSPTDYSGPANITQVVFIDKTITLLGGYDATFSTRDPAINTTFIDAGNMGRCAFITADANPQFDGLSFRNGNATGLSGTAWGDAGGAIFADNNSPIFNNCNITLSTADGGGGIFFNYCRDININNCICKDNHAFSSGGGIYLHSTTGIIENSTLDSNDSDSFGGGLYAAYEYPVILNNVFFGNSATQNGGGMTLYYSGADIIANLIRSNSADHGAAIRSYSSLGNITRNSIYNNNAINSGAAIYADSGTHLIANNFICQNYLTATSGIGSGLLLDGGDNTLTHNTIDENSGGNGSGIELTQINAPTAATATITNHIISKQATGVVIRTGSSATLTHIMWHNNTNDVSGSATMGPGMITDNPDYLNPTFHDYHISSSSPARNAGIDDGISDDFDGQYRPWDGGFDLGADEQRPIVFHGVWLNLPQTIHPGEFFFVNGFLENNGSELTDIQVYFMLDVAGNYWFWPSWSLFDPDTASGLDSVTMTIPYGQTCEPVLEPFTWPATGSATVSGLRFWGAMVDPVTFSLVGEVGVVEWSYGP